MVCAGGEGRGPDSGRPRKPSDGECAGRVRRRSYGAGRYRRNLPGRPASPGSGPSPPTWVPRPTARTRLLWLAAWGPDRPPGPRASRQVSAGPVGPGLEPRLAALRSLPGVSPDGAAAERVAGRPSDSAPEFVCGRSCGVWHPSPSFLPIGTCFFPEFSRCGGSRLSDPRPGPPAKLFLGLAKINK